MNDVRAKFEEIWPVPGGIEWDGRWSEYLPIDPTDGHLIDQCTELDTRLDTFTRCQETGYTVGCLVDNLIGELERLSLRVDASDQMSIFCVVQNAKHVLGRKQ